MSTGSTNVSKWQLAILIGAPIAIGLGYLYLKKKPAPPEERKSSDVEKTPLSEKNEAIGAGDCAVAKPKTKLEEALDYKHQGNRAFQNGKYEEAASLYEKAIETCPPDNKIDLATFYQNRAAAYAQLKNWQNVKSDCTKALQLNPKYLKALNRRARANENLEDLRECLEDLTAICILEGFQNNNSLIYADRILKQLGELDAKAIMAARKEPPFPSSAYIRAYMSTFANDPVIQMSVADLDSNSGFVKARKALDTKDYEQVIPFCTEEITKSEGESEYRDEALLLRATFYLLIGKYDECSADMETVLSNSEVRTDLRVNALVKRAGLQIQRGKLDAGFADFAEAQKLSPENADVYHQKGQVYIMMDKMQEASEEMDMAVKYAPNHGLKYVQRCFVYYKLAALQRNQSKLNEVLSDFNTAIERFPDCVDAYSLLAQVLTEQQQYDQADKFFAKAIEKEPEMAALYVHRGISQLQWNGNVDKALEYIKKSLEVDNKCQLAYETMGTISLQQGNLVEAVETYNKAIQLSRLEGELSHLLSLKNAAVAQINCTKKYDIDLKNLSPMSRFVA